MVSLRSSDCALELVKKQKKNSYAVKVDVGVLYVQTSLVVWNVRQNILPKDEKKNQSISEENYIRNSSLAKRCSPKKHRWFRKECN